MVINNKKYLVFFGDKQSCAVDYKTEEFDTFCNVFSQKHELNKVLFNKQIHTATGSVISSFSAAQSFKNICNDGDFLITDQKKIGLGILTADCLPIFFYDSKNQIIAAIHAGWRSSVLGICKTTLDTMNQKYGTVAQDVEVFFGPCAKSCCYEIQPDFLEKLKPLKCADKIIQKRNDKLFFDNVFFNMHLLKSIGFNTKKINRDYNLCTICNLCFNSYRRDNQTKYRQISFISIL